MEISRFKEIEYLEELGHLREQIPILMRRKQEARAEGDLSENTEYDVASSELNQAYLRQAALEELLANSKVTEIDDGPRIGVGSFIRVKNITNNFKEMILRLDNEGLFIADKPQNCVLTTDSALGKAVLNGISGEYTIQAPSGSLVYLVTKIPFKDAIRIFGLEDL